MVRSFIKNFSFKSIKSIVRFFEKTYLTFRCLAEERINILLAGWTTNELQGLLDTYRICLVDTHDYIRLIRASIRWARTAEVVGARVACFII